MLFIIFVLLFRVTPPKKYISFQNSKLEIKSYTHGCGNYDATLNESGDKDVNSVVECKTDDYDFIIKNCKFQNIHAKYFWKKATDLPDKLIVIKNVKGSIINNIINDCSTDEDQLILCEDNSDRTLKFNSNTITNCYKKDGGKYEILSTSYRNNEIMYNQITCSTDKNSRAFYIKYGRGCSFIGNTVKNANKGDSSAILINEQQSNDHKKLEIRDSIFINCKGDNNDGKNGGLILVIEKIDYDILISNTTFQDVKITNAKNADKSYLLRFESSSSKIYPVNFSNCQFIQIETISKAGGGIGFFYNTDGAKTIIFDHVIFNRVVCNHGSIGGGALCIDSSINGAKNTNLIVNGCQFIDCSSKCSGGAINFKSISSQLTVTNCHFLRTYTSSNQNGGAICIQFQQNSLPFSIKNCFFMENSASNGGSIFIQPNTDSSSSEVIIDNCDFKSASASTNGHSIYISHTDGNKVTISSCQVIDCGNDKNTYAVYLDVNQLDFKYNTISFSDPENSCGCVHLAIIGTHVFNGNLFKNAKYDGSMWKSPGINGDVTNELTSLLIQNNTFDSIHGTNQGRCFFIVRKGNNSVQIINNTIKNCPPGGSLLKIWFQTQINEFKIESCNFINNSIKDCYDLIGPTPHIWIENPFNGNHISPLELTLENCRFEKGSNTRKGGGLHYGKIKYEANIKLILNQCHFIDNFANEGGGAISVQTYQGCEIKNCKFIKNRSDNGCGSIFIETDFQCLKDNAEDKTAMLPLPDTRNPTVSITNSNFEDNVGKEKHGINVINSVNVPIEILECVFTNCGLDGFVISIDTDIQLNNIKNCTFNYTTEKTSGGLYNINDKLVLIGNSFCNFRETVIRFPCENNQKFQLIENTFYDCQNCYTLYIEKVLSYCPTIKGNHFDSISGNNQLCFIKFKDDIDTVTFENNSFTNFAMNSDYGGISLNINHENSNVLLTFVFNDCVFINNTNANLGGAISFGSNQNSGNVALTLKKCFFIKNYNDDKGSSIYYNVKNGITIDDCSFSENSGSVNGVVYIEQNYASDSSKTEVSITNCRFTQNKGKDSTIYLASGSTKTLKIEFCEFEQDNGGIYTDNFNNKIEIINNVFHETIGKAALVVNSPIKTENAIIIKDCIFDSCSGLENQCFNIVINTKLFSFLDNTIQNNKGTGCSNYFGTIDCNGEIAELNVHNISFINNTGNSLYGGGIGLQFKLIQQLTFDNCKFINNAAQQETSMSRPTKDSKVYYNGDGGGFQIGYSCSLNDVNLLFQNCQFINNHAFRHGGALSIQTIGFVKIINCLFENNEANWNSQSSKLLVDNYFDRKSKGRGGAIYINPSYEYDDDSLQCSSPDHFMNNVDITNSVFKNNNAYDGYGIYFEGDDPGPTFIINIADNTFTDNYNENNHNDDIYSIYGAVITTEIMKITEKQISNDNVFNYTIAELKVLNVSVVDHSGKTPTYGFTLSEVFTDSDPFPTDNFTRSQVFTYSSAFTRSNDFSDSLPFTSSNKFSESNVFSNTNQFSKSEGFSNSNDFTKSDLFTDSNVFPPSNKFSESDLFSNSGQFTRTSLFTNSNYFSKTDLFSNSDQFSSSRQFTKSNFFSDSNYFSKSGFFSKTDQFSSTNQFSETDFFSYSIQFSKSSSFSDSKQFSSSKQFSESKMFSNSEKFSKSGLFSYSKQFSESELFTISSSFSDSKQFSSSKQFSESNKFTSSELFSKSYLFSYSKQFSESELFTKSSSFSDSKQFSSSKHFSESNIFSKTELFSKSHQFSISSQFSLSEQFTKSQDFSKSREFDPSDYFSKSEIFSNSIQFTQSQSFSQSSDFSKSSLFTLSDLFTNSKIFSNSIQFSHSNIFSRTGLFSKSNLFSLTEIFSQSNDFSKSDQFSKSQCFSLSSTFSKSNKFSNSAVFSQTQMFSQTKQFTETYSFTQSGEFSNSGKFSRSAAFSYSVKFSNSFYFSETDLFTQSNDLTKSNKFTISDLFTRSFKFTFSKQFSKSHLFSQSNDFTVTNKFSQSLLFSKSIDFTGSNKFSRSNLFSQTKKFSGTSEFSISNSFTQSRAFSNSNQFSSSNLFTQTNDFSPSKELNTNLFSKSNQFTLTGSFSRTNDFTKSKPFSKSNAFSESDKFKPTDTFSYSNGFSESIAFSMSEPFENKEPKCVLYVDGESHLLNDCNYSRNDGKNVLIQVISTNFTNMVNNINGTAIHIDNCALLCNRTLFMDCVTSEGCGGAIYIRNEVDLHINITFEDLIFIKCKAACGGAVFIHSQFDDNEVLIRNCTFLSNNVYNRNSNKNDLFGGSALYIASNNANIIDCAFKENKGKGGCVKIKSIDNRNHKIVQLETIQKPLMISGCTFENDIKSDSSIFYSNDNKYNAIKISQCNFKGKLKKGSNYIDGNVIDKDNFQIKNCNFDDDFNISVTTEKFRNNITSMHDNMSFNLHKIIIYAFVFILSFIVILTMIKYHNYAKNNIKSFKLNRDQFENNEDLILNDL